MLGFLKTTVIALTLMAIAMPASARRAPSDWVLLGEQEVGFRVDRDTIRVGSQNARFSQLRIQTERSDVHLISVQLIYQNGYAERFRVDRIIAAGTEALPIDLRGERSYLKQIDLVYRSDRDSRRRAIVRVYGELKRRLDLGRFKPIDQQRISRRNDDGIVEFSVGRDDGRIAKLQLLAEGGDIFIRQATIVFGNGEMQRVRIRDRIDENTLSEVIDLAGESRFIRRVTVRARLARGERNARLVLLALEDRDRRGRRDRRGDRGGRGDRLEWVTLGRENADLFKIDTDTFRVGRDMGKFSAIRATVERQAVHFYGMTIKYGNGSTEHVALDGMIRPGEFSQKFDLRGRDRFIDTITFKYRSKISLRGSGVIEIQGLQYEGPSRRR